MTFAPNLSTARRRSFFAAVALGGSVVSLLVAMSFEATGCASHTARPAKESASEVTICEPGSVADGGVCVPIDPACPEHAHLEFGRGCVRDDAPLGSTDIPPGLSPDPIPSVQIEDVVVGSGAIAQAGKTITVHYTGRLDSGEVFDSSIDRGQPFTATLGKGMLIKGWEEGMIGMRVGGKRRIRIAPAKGYGERGVPPKIPPNSVLRFEIELLEVK